MADDFDSFTPGGTGRTYTSTISPSFGGGQAPGSSSSSGSSQSTSTPQIMDSAQSNWGLVQSQLLDALGDAMMNWSMDKIAKGEQITDQMVGNFIELSGKGKGLADTLMQQYQDQFKPLMDQYIRDAGSYASKERQDFMAGRAMSTVGQADQAAMEAAQRKLQAFGANPNSGEYKELLLSNQTRDAAARAGAGTQAALDTADRGRQMTEKALAMGQNLPGQAMNAVNSAYAGLTGAENSLLSMINSAGALISQTVAPFKNAAVNANKLPPVAQNQQSTSQQESASQQQTSQQGSGGGSGGGGKPKEQQGGKSGGGGGDDKEGKGSSNKSTVDVEAPQKFGPPAGAGAYGQAYDIRQSGRDDENDAATGADSMRGYEGATPFYDASGNLLSQWSPDTFEQGKNEGWFTTQFEGEQAPNWSMPDVNGNGFNVDPGSVGGDNFQLGNSYNPDAGFNDIPTNRDTPNTDDTFDPLQNWNQNAASYNDQQDQSQQASNDDYGSDYTDFGASDYSDDISYDDTSYDDSASYDDSGYDDYSDDYSDYDSNGYYANDYGGSDSYDDSYSDDSYYDNSGGYDDYGGDYGGDYAHGGPVQRVRPQQRGVIPMGGGSRQQRRPPTTGGPVPRSASPSQGRQTDDISARLNAGEYVIPRDVVAHQGTKFFTDLIAKSRKLRTGMAGAAPKPTMRPPLRQQRPSFTSRPMR